MFCLICSCLSLQFIQEWTHLWLPIFWKLSYYKYYQFQLLWETQPFFEYADCSQLVDGSTWKAIPVRGDAVTSTEGMGAKCQVHWSARKSTNSSGVLGLWNPKTTITTTLCSLPHSFQAGSDACLMEVQHLLDLHDFVQVQVSEVMLRNKTRLFISSYQSQCSCIQVVYFIYFLLSRVSLFWMNRRNWRTGIAVETGSRSEQ